MTDIKLSASVFINEKTGNIKDIYKITGCIGRGAYGEVRKCQHKETKVQRAVKIINKNCLEEEEKNKMLTEIDILRKMDHPNILKLYEFFQDEKRYFLVTEICKGGELFDKISDESYFNEHDAANLMKQVLSAINYCHSRKIVHRDLKPENLLLDADVENPKIKIIDFGTSQQYDPTKKMTQKFGTPYYIAPEVLKKSYNEKCDLWSCGVILYILLCGYPPFNGANDKQIIEAVLKGKFTLDEPEWDGITNEAKDLVRQLLAYEPEKRASAQEALLHPWIQKMASGEKVEKAVAMKTLQNFRSFRSDQKLKQATLSFIATQLVSKEETQDLEKIFAQIDTNGDGQLSKEELANGYENAFGVPITQEEIDKLFEEIDVDGSGAIDYSEFVMATMS